MPPTDGRARRFEVTLPRDQTAQNRLFSRVFVIPCATIRKIQNPVAARSCGFESHLRYMIQPELFMSFVGGEENHRAILCV